MNYQIKFTFKSIYGEIVSFVESSFLEGKRHMRRMYGTAWREQWDLSKAELA